MAKRNWGKCLYGAGMSFLLAASGVACLLTAFEVDCSVAAVLIFSMIGAVVWSVSFTTNHWLLPLCIYALAAGYLWRSDLLYDSFWSLSYAITTIYNRVRGWQVRGFEGSATAVMALFAVTLTMCSCWMFCKKRGRILTVLVALLPLLPCFLTAETAPQPLWLGIWLFGITMVLLVPKCNTDKRLAAFLVAPVALVSVLVLLLLPQSKQEKPRLLAQQIREALQDTGFVPPPGKPLKVSGGAMELNKLGPREEALYPVMTVKSDRTGTLYLRGCAYDTYAKNIWTNMLVPEKLYWPAESALESAGIVTIKSDYALELCYFPYYATGDTLTQVTRSITNYGKKTAYTYEVAVLADVPDTYTSKPDHGYCQIPTLAYYWAKPVVEQLITEKMTDAEKIAAISDYVNDLATYSLYAERMPEDEQEFVVWFAKTAEQGYCVHFATAGAVLLRAAGIPTRFVTGYMVQTEAGQETTVYGKDAHAWAECFLDGVGWVPVELTPGVRQEQPEVSPQPIAVRKTIEPRLILYSCSALLVGTIAAVLARWQVHVLQRRRKRKKGDERDRILAIYSQLTELLSLDGKKPSEGLQCLVEEIRFSNHPIPNDALDIMEKAFKHAKKAIKKHNFIRRIHYRLILNLY